MEKKISYEKTVQYSDLDTMANISTSRLHDLINNDTFKVLEELGLTTSYLKKNQLILFTKNMSVNIEKSPQFNDQLLIQTTVKTNDEMINSHTTVLKDGQKICELLSEYELQNAQGEKVAFSHLSFA